MSKRMWMVRAGQHAYLIEEFRKKNLVAIGWRELGDISKVASDKSRMIERVQDTYPDFKPGRITIVASQLLRFYNELRKNDYVMTYDPNLREYPVGEIQSDTRYDKKLFARLPSVRKVSWKGAVKRENLSTTAKNSLGAINTLFEVKEEVRKEILALLHGKPKKEEESLISEPTEMEELYEETISKASEFILDKVMALDWEEMQELVAGILRAMGFKTRVSPKGSDRGKDIFASPDGLGLEDPRIIVEVKHRNSQMGSNAIRSFIGALRQGCKGVYVSTGGFSKEGRYEAERANIPVTLIDSTELVDIITRYYDQFDSDTKALIPLKKFYWPV
ncbi:restriction endonuclease [Candidatus Riflebacteria bacterium]